HVRITATTSLRNFGNEAKDAVQALIARLDDEDSRVRSAAADTLGEIGNHAKNSLVHLRKLEEDHDEQVRLSVNRAIKKIDKENQTESEAIPTSATE
ncbi:MAG: HEAT repeat domain-containing protein, partial [Planctomycetes bacterium]|nr:HEAT repeat domain-containing protein [Planctomycetota bacterium]